MTTTPASPAVVALIGAGPRGVGLLERLTALAPALLSGRQLEIHVIDADPFGGHWPLAERSEPWRAVRTAPAGVCVRTHRTTAVDLTGRPDGPQRVTLDPGPPIVADLVLLAQGRPGTAPDPEQRARAAFADWYGLHYHRPREGEAPDLGAILAGVDVLIRDAGPVTDALVTLLLERRGGRFVPTSDGSLRYRSSGAEPRVHLLAPDWPNWTHETTGRNGSEWRRRRAALVAAGVAVRHPASAKLTTDAVRGAFLLQRGADQVAARTLIEPDARFGPLRASADPLLRALAERGELAGWSGAGATLDRQGREHGRRFAFGRLVGPTSSTGQPEAEDEAAARRALTLLAALPARPVPAPRRDVSTIEAGGGDARAQPSPFSRSAKARSTSMPA